MTQAFRIVCRDVPKVERRRGSLGPQLIYLRAETNSATLIRPVHIRCGAWKRHCFANQKNTAREYLGYNRLERRLGLALKGGGSYTRNKIAASTKVCTFGM